MKRLLLVALAAITSLPAQSISYKTYTVSDPTAFPAIPLPANSIVLLNGAVELPKLNYAVNGSKLRFPSSSLHTGDRVTIVSGLSGIPGPQGPAGPPGSSAMQYANVEEYSPAIGAIDGSNANFALSNIPAANTTVCVYLNGVKADPTATAGPTAYSLNGKSIIFKLAPVPGDQIAVNYWHQ